MDIRGVNLNVQVYGHGKSQPSTHPQDYHFHNLPLDMLAIADSLNIDQFIAGGGSMGCMTSIYAALECPKRIMALVLMLPATVWETRIAQARRYWLLALAGRLVGGSGVSRAMSRSIDRFIPAWMVNQAGPQVLSAYTMGLKTMKRRTMWNLFRGVASSDLPPRERLSALAGIPSARRQHGQPIAKLSLPRKVAIPSCYPNQTLSSMRFGT